MAESARPQIFVRNATGLRKEAGTFDVFVYNTNNQNIGLGVAFLFLLLGAYAGGNFPLSAVLASLLVVPLYFVYSRLSADMPRSGGDYVWTSRIFGARWGPMIGFTLAWTWIILAITAIGAPAAFFAQLGVAGWMRSLGVATGSAVFGQIGDWVSSQFGSIAVGTILLVFFTWILIRGVRTYMRIQNIAFILAMAGVVLGILAALLTSPSGFTSHFDAYVTAAGGKAGASQLVMANAPAATGFSAEATFYAMLWTIYMVLFGATSCYIGGEVRRPGTTQRLGMIGSLILTGISIALLVTVVSNALGTAFIGGLSNTPAGDLGLAFLPTYNELLMISFSPSLLWAVGLGFTFLFWTYVWMPINYFTATRLMLALSLDGYLPASVSKVHEKYATPHIAILVAFVLGEASLVLFVMGILSVITLLFAGVVMFVITGIAAVLYPSRLKEVWTANGGETFAGVPTIRIWGALLIPAMLIVLYILWNDPVVGIGHSTLQMVLNIGLPISGLVLFYGIWAYRSSKGFDVRLSATEIPPD
jgi:APA family basic amino acid/polyamine antiporter